MSDDPTIHWAQASFFGIQIDEEKDAWHSGHIDDIVKLDEPNDVLVVATQSGGAWVIVDGGNPLQLSDTWDNPDVKTLAAGPDASRHLFAGCTLVYSGDPAGSAPVIMETDVGAVAPLFDWKPVSPALPVTAGRVMRIQVIRNLRRIVIACAKVQGGDTGGIFWSTIPPSRLTPADPPRQPYEWKQAKFRENACTTGYWDLAIASLRDEGDRRNLEDRNIITVLAGGYGGGGLYVGQWDENGDLVFKSPTVAFDDGTDATAVFLASAGTTSVSSCETLPMVVYAASAWPDGRLNVILRSKDGGVHWAFCAAGMADAEGPIDLVIAHAGDQGRNWNNCIAAHPGNPGMAALGWQNGTFITRDGGTKWKLIDDDIYLHHDVHALLFSKDTPEFHRQPLHRQRWRSSPSQSRQLVRCHRRSVP